MTTRRYAILAMVVAISLSAIGTTAKSATWPERPVRIVVPFTPGGNVDIVARIVAEGLQSRLSQTVLVENKPGANAAIGAEMVAHSTADGYTLLLATAETHALNPHLRKSLPYNPLKDFTSVGMVDQFPFSLVISPNLPVSGLADFIRYAKKQDGKLNFASWGNGSTSQIAFEQIKQATGIRLQHIPFKGAAPAIAAVAAGNVEAFVVPLSVARPQATGGRVRLLAVLSAERVGAAPDVPTALEQGVNVVIDGWHLLAAPSGTPAAIVDRLNTALNEVLKDESIREKLLKAGVRPAGSTPAEANATVVREYQGWGAVARKAGIEPD